MMSGYNDNSFTRISPRICRATRFMPAINPNWASIDGAVDIHENRDNAFTVNNLEHGRTYSFCTTLAPYPTLWIDFGYNYMDIFTQTEICFADTGSTMFTAACPVFECRGRRPGTLSMYASQDHYAYADVMWKPYKRVTATFGYMGSIVRGNTTFLNPLDPTGTLDVNYLKPYRQPLDRFVQGHLLQNLVELLRLQRSRHRESDRTRAAAFAKFRRKQYYVFAEVFILSGPSKENP